MSSGHSIRVVREIDPLQDFRWTTLVRTHPCASIFHSRRWLEALRRTYGYTPVAFTTSSDHGPLENALLFATVPSWLTGRRIVSLPFSDHCQPLFGSAEDLQLVLTYLQAEMQQRSWRYVEIRPRTGAIHGSHSSSTYCAHQVDLEPDLKEIFRRFDEHSVQRRIRHSERAGLTERQGCSADLLADFYKLMILTRRRHGLPPQPRSWFRNLLACLGDAAEIRVAYSGPRVPIAAILTLRFRDALVYKYGCSDRRFDYLGAMPLLLWRAIQDAKSTGARRFDLGRTDPENQGLVSFKERWTKQSAPLVYWRFPAAEPALGFVPGRVPKLTGFLLSHMPCRMLTAAGRLAYRHIG